jgi:hypothetical protein
MERLLLVLAVAVCACSKKPAVPVEPPAEAQIPAPPRPAVKALDMVHPEHPEHTTWSVHSADGAATLEQTEGGDSCDVHCTARAGELWASDRCIGSSSDAVFIANDCSTAIVVITQPKTSRPWEDTTVLLTYKGPHLQRSFTGGPMLDTKQVQQNGPTFVWLKEPPHYMRSGGGIEFQVMSGRITRLPLGGGDITKETVWSVGDDGGSVALPPAPAQAKRPEDEQPAEEEQPQAAEPAPTPAPAPEEPKPLCGPRGCYQQLRQDAPTINAPPGEATVCHGAGEACGSNADCCGGTCSEGSCR